MVRIALIALFVVMALVSEAQLVIHSVDKTFAAANELVSIKGSGFGSTAANLVVYFGGAKGTISSVSDQLLEVLTPFGTSFERITVFNKTTGLGAASPQPFFLNYGGTHGISNSNLKPQVDFFANSGLYDHCLCDFDGDSRLDVATANSTSNVISLLRNSSTPGSLSFIKTDVTVTTTGTIHTRCGDINGDGLSDLLVSEFNGSKLFLFRNTGGFSFNITTLTFAGRKLKRPEIADLDGDGKPEVIITDQGAGDIIVLPNISTTSTISFGPTKIIPVPGFASTDGISVIDLNGDELADIVIDQFQQGSGNIVVIKNSSTPGNINLSNQVTLTVPGTMVNVKLGDIDGDGLPDIVASILIGSNGINVLRNKSASDIQFGTPEPIAISSHLWGVDLGDLDGDGKLDIVLASVTDPTLTILNNNSTIGNIAFTISNIATTYVNREVRIADMDNDGKPDITFTSVDFLGNISSKVSIIRNASCMTPAVTPGGPLTICAGFPLRLNASVGGGITYQWFNNAVSIPGATSSFFDVTVGGNYTVVATAEGGSCVKTSNAVNVTVNVGPGLGTAAPTNNGPVCLKGTLQLNVADVGATQYKWRGPEGYTGTGVSPASVANFTYDNAGRYFLDVYSGTCIVQQASTVVDAVAFPSFRVATASTGLLCQGQNAALTLVPSASNVTYQWFEKTNGAISGQTSSSFTASASGNYFGKVTSTLYPACQPSVSDTVSIKVLNLPVPDFVLPSPSCAGQSLTFADQSTSDSQATVLRSWTFGDSGTATDVNPTHTYVAANSYPVKLTLSYTGGICSQSVTKPLSVQVAPPLSITAQGSVFAVCDGASITLTASAGFSSYAWSNSATGQSITVTSADTYTVTATAANSCVIKAAQVVTQLPTPVITISADPTLVDEGKPVQLSASGLANYAWSPGKTLTDSTSANTVAYPVVTTTYVVKGKAANGCSGEDSVTVNVKGENLVNKLKPTNFFSPGNGDNINEKWEVENIDTFPQCAISIFDEKGLKVYEAKPYTNASGWDGSYNGKLLPIGVYYYIIKCDGDTKAKTGSITIVR
ncbi:hypothetical protein WSM22_25050 [Cytophagales bacterium WSM2-2]|nr:hypothetical protein WSM22_25050 [Cytophagales bacterium WSM2-2]